MCGIAGILDFSNYPDTVEIERMLSIILHRGPDSKGTYVNGPLSMGIRRLSIIDIERGDQPIYSEEKDVCVVCNGEIYNYLELRKELIRKGHRFYTNSDTEVLVHLYEEYGTNMLTYLNGMFAFALWDANNKSLFLARDRIGIKPLYYTMCGHRLVFASELKALLTQETVNTDLDNQSIMDYLLLGYIPREATPYKSIKKLLPGSLLIGNEKNFSISHWWSLADTFNSQSNGNIEDKKRQLVEDFDDSVRLRMRSDVPVATFLSGGVDSSLVTATATNLANERLRTYSVGYENPTFDEIGFARLVAKSCKSRHHETTVDSETLCQLLPFLVWHLDEPSADATIVPHYVVSKTAAEKVKVCLTGLGGDELFGGYQHYIDFKPTRGRVKKLFGNFPNISGWMAPLFKEVWPALHNELTLIKYPFLTWRRHFPRMTQCFFERQELIEMGFTERIRFEDTLESLWREYPGGDSVGQRQYVDLKTYLPDQLLAFTDKMSMAVSIEARVPFLDHRLIMLSSGIPGHLKNNREGDFKQFLKDTLGYRLPPEIIKREKFGFSPPITRWIGYDQSVSIARKLPERLSDIISQKYVRALVKDESSIMQNPIKVWTLIVLAVWLSVHQRALPPRTDLRELF